MDDGPTGTAIEHYAYDATGNRLSMTNAGITTNYTYPAASHRLTQVGAITRNYDAAGNTTKIGGTARQFVYDATGRMSQVKAGSTVTMNYKYNGRGEQVRKYLGTANTYTVYDEAGHWLGDYDSTGAAIQQAIWLDDLPVGLLVGVGSGQQLHYLEPDHLGTPRVAIDPVRDVAVWTWDIKGEAFGNTAPEQDADGDGTGFVLDMRFAGQRADAASGLNYNYFRGYDTSTGRYVESDPIGLGGGVSTYAYVGGNPVTGIDSLGLETCVVVTTTSSGIRDHSGLYMSRGGSGGSPFLFDPAGSYARSHGGGEGDFVEGDAANLDAFAKHHSNEKVEKTCKNTSQAEEQRLANNVVNGPSPGIATCAINVSNILSGSPYFPNVRAGTLFPGNLFRDAGASNPNGGGGR